MTTFIYRNTFKMLIPFIRSIKTFLLKRSRQVDTEPAIAYDQWAASYDSQPDNLMLALDEKLFADLLADINITAKIIADIGCGTGRHWKKIMDEVPAKLIGFDVSAGMLQVLQQKFPLAETYQLTNGQLQGLANQSCDVVISTLTIAHIDDAAAAMKEWCRVLKPGGEMIITDYHPIALARGAKRTFNNGGKTMAIVNHIYPIDQVKTIAAQLQLQEMRLIEKEIDDTMRPYYEKQQALKVFEAWKGVPIIYGIRFKKAV